MKTAILLVAYGSNTQEGRNGINFFEQLCRARFPEYPVRWAYTSSRMRERLALERQKSDSVAKALQKLHFEKFQLVHMQSLQTICGREYEETAKISAEVSQQTGMIINQGEALLAGENDLARLAQALITSLPEERSPEQNIIFMGHGARHPAARYYELLSSELSRLDRRVFLGTMRQGELERIMARLDKNMVWLMPLLAMAGRHALHDMAGEHAESWKSRVEKNGNKCKCVLKGLSQAPLVANIWLDKLAATMDKTVL